MTAPRSPAPLWTPWGKGFKGVALRSALGPPSVQRPALVSYTTPGDANFGAIVSARFERKLREASKPGFGHQDKGMASVER
jgi:hypothetical protein